jgi:hypothetical protein
MASSFLSQITFSNSLLPSASLDPYQQPRGVAVQFTVGHECCDVLYQSYDDVLIIQDGHHTSRVMMRRCLCRVISRHHNMEEKIATHIPVLDGCLVLVDRGYEFSIPLVHPSISHSSVVRARFWRGSSAYVRHSCTFFLVMLRCWVPHLFVHQRHAVLFPLVITHRIVPPWQQLRRRLSSANSKLE